MTTLRKVAAIAVMVCLSLLVPVAPAHAAPTPDIVMVIGPNPWVMILCGEELETGMEVCANAAFVNSIVWGGDGAPATFEATNGIVATVAVIFLINYLIYEALTAPPSPVCYNCSDGFRNIIITTPAQ